MNELVDLKRFLENNKIKIKEFRGNTLITESGDIWTLVLGIFYRNGELVVEKDFVKSFNPNKKDPKPKRHHFKRK